MKTIKMSLNDEPFEKIKSGIKSFELRLYDAKRREIDIGDTILFTNRRSGEILQRTVLKLHLFRDFAELYSSLPLLKCGYTELDVDSASPRDMLEYYSLDEQKKHGVVGIELGN